MAALLAGLLLLLGLTNRAHLKRALEAILNLEDVESYVFFQPGVSIFHPKIYLFEGNSKSVVIVGSSNLTTQGLFVNVEASLKLKIDHTDTSDMAILAQVKHYYDGLYNLSDPNLSPLSDSVIQTLVAANIVPTEPERRILYSKSEGASSLRAAVTGVFPRRALPAIPALFRNNGTGRAIGTASAAIATTTTPAGTTPTAPAPVATAPAGAHGNLVWVRQRLPASSVQQFSQGTNPTGGLRLVQDGFTVGGRVIDQTTYFRNIVFGGYLWAQISATPFVEVAVVPFDITIKGTNVGIFNLNIRHKPSGVAGQGNYTTLISWGNAVSQITAQNLTNSRLELHAPTTVGGPFQILIF